VRDHPLTQLVEGRVPDETQEVPVQYRPGRQQDVTGEVREGEIVVFDVVPGDFIAHRSEGRMDLANVTVGVPRDNIDALL
jgi:hypothetical protein